MNNYYYVDNHTNSVFYSANKIDRNKELVQYR